MDTAFHAKHFRKFSVSKLDSVIFERSLEFPEKGIFNSFPVIHQNSFKWTAASIFSLQT